MSDNSILVKKNGQVVGPYAVATPVRFVEEGILLTNYFISYPHSRYERYQISIADIREGVCVAEGETAPEGKIIRVDEAAEYELFIIVLDPKLNPTPNRPDSLFPLFVMLQIQFNGSAVNCYEEDIKQLGEAVAKAVCGGILKIEPPKLELSPEFNMEWRGNISMLLATICANKQMEELAKKNAETIASNGVVYAPAS